MTIPPKVHFFWTGPHLPWAYVFAILSAAENSGISEVVLHHTDILSDGPELRALKRADGVILSHIDSESYLNKLGEELGFGDKLSLMYKKLTRPAMKSDLMRGAILYTEGGIYLDTDTVTISSLVPFLNNSVFIGSEFIVWPQSVRSSRSPITWARHLTLDVVRNILRRLPEGWKFFRKIENFYFLGVNGAVMGSTAKSLFLSDYLHAMLAVPSEHLADANVIGPDLLQALVNRYNHDDLTIVPPEAFYPLPPEISEHWFRNYHKADLDSALTSETCIVHWYASVRTKSRVALITPEYIKDNRHNQLYSAMIWKYLEKIQEFA